MIPSEEKMEGLFIDEDISRYALTIYTKFVKIVFSSPRVAGLVGSPRESLSEGNE